MAEMTSFNPGQFCWVELAAGSADATAFYTALFGWEPVEIPMPDGVYVMLKKNGRTAAALYHEKNAPPHWNNYVAVASADESAAKAKELGAKVMMAPFDVMDVGRMAVIADPTGGILALWEARRTKGVEVFGEPGAMCWNELTTHDAAAAKAFYSQLFGWTVKGDEHYTEWHLGDRGVGGMMEMKDAPVGWFPYFAVENCDASAAKVKELGGRIYKEPTDIEHVGRFAIVSDAQGAVFAIIQLAM